jgi:hypothetical protein
MGIESTDRDARFSHAFQIRPLGRMKNGPFKQGVIAIKPARYVTQGLMPCGQDDF